MVTFAFPPSSLPANPNLLTQLIQTYLLTYFCSLYRNKGVKEGNAGGRGGERQKHLRKGERDKEKKE